MSQRSVSLFEIGETIKEFRAYSPDQEVGYGMLVENAIEQWYNHAWDNGSTKEYIKEVLQHFDNVEDQFSVGDRKYILIPDVPPTSYLIPAPVFSESRPDFGIRV